jgi:hypothetical protein
MTNLSLYWKQKIKNLKKNKKLLQKLFINKEKIIIMIKLCLLKERFKDLNKNWNLSTILIDNSKNKNKKFK